MDLGVISVRYARALLKSAAQAHVEETVYQEMQLLFNNYLNIPALRQTIDNPMLAKEQKQELLEIASGGQPKDATAKADKEQSARGVSQLSSRFFALVLDEGREGLLQLMAASYIDLYRKQKNITRGKLTTAVAVSPETELKMRRMVEQNTKGTVEFETEVDPNIIGGFILEYDTYRMDASVKTKLNTILNTLKK